MKREVLRAVSEAFSRAAPNRRTSLERAVERAFWGSTPHAPGPHCPLCGDADGVLVAQLGHHCDRCLRVCYGTLVELRVGQAPPPWEMALAEVARALRGEQENDSVLSALEARIFGRDPAPEPCARCGEIGRWPRPDAASDVCGICRRARAETPLLVAGPVTGLCEQCIDAGHRYLLRPR